MTFQAKRYQNNRKPKTKEGASTIPKFKRGCKVASIYSLGRSRSLCFNAIPSNTMRILFQDADCIKRFCD